MHAIFYCGLKEICYHLESHILYFQLDILLLFDIVLLLLFVFISLPPLLARLGHNTFMIFLNYFLLKCIVCLLT